MQITINDEPREIPDSATVATLLQKLDVEPRRVAVEVNLNLVPRTRHAEHVLSKGDRLEIVTLVGGG